LPQEGREEKTKRKENLIERERGNAISLGRGAAAPVLKLQKPEILVLPPGFFYFSHLIMFFFTFPSIFLVNTIMSE